MKESVLIKRIKDYVKKNPPGWPSIAAACKLQSNYTPQAWVKNHKVPLWHQQAVERFLNEVENGNPSQQ